MMSEKKRILIVDDIPEYVDVLKLLLDNELYEIVEAHSFKEAVKKLKEKRPILAIIDVRLKEEEETNKEGLELLKIIKKEYPEIKVIMVSAYKEFEFKAESLELGAEFFLEKPIKPSLFKEIVEKLLEEKR